MRSEADTDPDAFAHALAAVSSSQYEEAERRVRAFLGRHPEHEGALSVLGLALFEQRKYAEAVECFRQLTYSKPSRAVHWKNMGAALRAIHRYQEAFLCYAQAASCGAKGPRFLYEAALLELDRDQPASALNLLRRARCLAPSDADIHVFLAECCMRACRHEEARRVLRGWRLLQPLTDELLARIAALHQTLGEAREASEALKQMSSAPYASALLVASHVYERGNQLEQAEWALARAEAQEGLGMEAEFESLRARLAARRGEYARACAHWEKHLTLTQQPRHDDLFAYAKSLDANAQPEDAFRTLQAAHRAQLAELENWTPEALRSANIESITGRQPASLKVHAWRDSSAPRQIDSPIFIISFPRSGTTLLEQSLDSHPDLVSMDEQPFLQQTIDAWVAQGIAYPDALNELSQEQLREAREMYWRLVRSRVDLQSGQRLIDKNPLNLLRLPVILRLFPRASIVLVIRNPFDVIWSCYSQAFASPEFALVCRDLVTLADSYRKMFDYYYSQAAVLNAPVYEISYERLVADFDGEIRKLCAALQLMWHPNVLEPSERAKRKPYISTPSYAQVLQPITARAIGRWQQHRAELEPLRSIVQPYLSRWGYSGDLSSP